MWIGILSRMHHTFHSNEESIRANECYDLRQVHLFLALLQLMQLGLAQLSESSPGTQLVRNGPAGTDQFPSWELSYYAANYRPICGLSFEAEGFYYWSNSGECEPAMSTFNVTMDSFAMYDTSGIKRRGNSEDEIASGSALCYCFTLLTPQNVMMNICFLIGGGGEVRLKAGVAVGVFDPSSVSEKALPLCKNVNLSIVISSIDATSQNKGTPTVGQRSIQCTTIVQ
jgi:hypothetical protein